MRQQKGQRQENKRAETRRKSLLSGTRDEFRSRQGHSFHSGTSLPVCPACPFSLYPVSELRLGRRGRQLLKSVAEYISPVCQLINQASFIAQSSKESACSAGDPDSVPGSERSPGEGNGSPLQYSSLEKPMDRGVWRVIVHGVKKKSQMQLSY